MTDLACTTVACMYVHACGVGPMQIARYFTFQ